MAREVTIYTTPNCSYCKMAKKFLADNDIGAWEDSHGNSYLGNQDQGILVSSVLSGAELTIGPDNRVKENSGHGIDILWGQTDSSIEIHHNFVDHNGPWVCGTGIKLGSGGVCGAIVRDNIITHNHKGIHLDEYSTQNTIRNNEIRDNGHGVWVEGDDNQILHNDILNNVEVTSGIHLTSYATGNIIRCNNIEGNLPYGVYNENVDEMVDATKNWWGHASGPLGAGPGSGDPVSANVTYAPWLATEFQYCPECGGALPVGGTAYPINKLAILVPWIVLGAAIIAGVSLLALRRRQTQS